MAGMASNYCNFRILYRAILWCCNKEKLLKKAFCDNVNVECTYYQKTNKYAIINNTNKIQKTMFYDIEGVVKHLKLSPFELLVL